MGHARNTPPGIFSGAFSQGLSQGVPIGEISVEEVWGRRRRGSEVQQGVVVLEPRGPPHLEEVQEEGQPVGFLEETQVRHASQAGQGLPVLVVDEERSQAVEAVQGEGRHVAVLEGQRLRVRQVRLHLRSYPKCIPVSISPKLIP